MTTAARGHRSVEHTADVTLEAWAPTPGACIEETVRALVESFLDMTSAVAVERHEFALRDGADHTDRLVEVLGEVIYVLDARDRVPLSVTVDPAVVRLELAATDGLPLVGAVPKAVTYHGLRVARDDVGTWRAQVTIDV